MSEFKLNMIEGNAWEYHGKSGCKLCITTNGSIDSMGAIVTGAGIAQQATDKYPRFPFTLGKFVRESGLHVYYVSDNLISFPVKYKWHDKADLRLIIYSLRELLVLSNIYPAWQQIILPRPGCGNGQLQWPEVEWQILEAFKSDIFAQQIMNRVWFITDFSEEKRRHRKS